MIMLSKLFRTRPHARMGETLYERAVDQARQPDFYTTLGVADQIDARFELYTLHALLLILRLRDDDQNGDEGGAEAAQALFDTYVSALDHALRELGVGDTSVGKKMRKLGEAFYGRVKSYESAFAALPRTDHLHALLGRTVYAQGGAGHVAELGEYVLRQRAALADLKLESLLEGRADWGAA